MHEKDFEGWSKVKEAINETHRPNVNVRDVRWCAIGHNIGSEIDGKGEAYARPVLVLKFISNNTCLVLPLTHSNKTGAHMLPLSFKDEDINARLDQIKIVDTKRLKTKIGRLSEDKVEAALDAVKSFIFKD